MGARLPANTPNMAMRGNDERSRGPRAFLTNVYNFDARAGGISEVDDAGADIDLIRAAAGPNQASTTVRYIPGTTGSRERSRPCVSPTVRPVNGTRTEGLGNVMGNASSTV
jgi:hypothetical protein